ncbi:hypothetical protein VP1G_03548 [Cytospora mali]|uniref:BTB domain transcription factor n=1 Tax=Cytospora mali TaxID=578113 RepID=A0A194UWX8_CYTMA|nr:hypothetical protein VP1G_03548 [Valsa mali var. pyri (nom. inval.)]
MAQTRSGAGATAGDKHKLDEGAKSPSAKAQKTDGKKQTTLDATITSDKSEEAKTEDSGDENQDEQNDKQNGNQNSNQNSEHSQPKSSSTKEDSAVEPHGRNGSTPSNILEKGIIYFFFRGRVGIENPEKVSDVARSYFILRPIPKDAKLGDGPIGDAGNSRLVAIPKKIFPQSGRERWIAFVEKTDVSFDQLKKEFLASNDYDTKTAGMRHSPAATPIAEGVYAITTTGRESHLAYMLTLPEKLGEVQTKVGLKEKGSWIVSTRNPQYPAPSNTQLPQGPEFSKEILDEFRSLRWMGTLPKHLVPNSQFLLVGESSGIQKAMQPDEKDENDENKEQSIEEMEELEHEDTQRMEHLGKDDSDAIFADLEVQAKNYPKLQTEF